MVVVLVAGIYRAYITQVSNHNDNFLLLAKMLNKMLEKFNDAVKVETGANWLISPQAKPSIAIRHDPTSSRESEQQDEETYEKVHE